MLNSIAAHIFFHAVVDIFTTTIRSQILQFSSSSSFPLFVNINKSLKNFVFIFQKNHTCVVAEFISKISKCILADGGANLDLINSLNSGIQSQFFGYSVHETVPFCSSSRAINDTVVNAKLSDFPV